MTAIELLQLAGAAVAGGALTKFSDPFLALLTARQQGRKVDAEAFRVTAEASKISVDSTQTPFKQATELITGLVARVAALEVYRDGSQGEREKLLKEIAECHQERALLADRVARLERPSTPSPRRPTRQRPAEKG